ncbi:MAG: FIST C-terminal domain-containing protein, partial [Bdellovibrionales bacterium]|nr:FIST C-terminal domain-containing protein [Bdellovibrionales bacterium]
MKVEQLQWTAEHQWQPAGNMLPANGAQLVLLFGHRTALEQTGVVGALQTRYPQAHIVGCSTAGEIAGTRVHDSSVVANAVQFEHTQVRIAALPCESIEQSNSVGKHLGKMLPTENLRHVLIFSTGLDINGSELVRGLTQVLPPGVTITGGLAGDGDKFQRTVVIADDQIGPRLVSIVGLYGDHLRVAYGSKGGWDSFGPERLITKSKGNILYEFDGKSALDLYRGYLGDQAKDLPGSALLFPLSVRENFAETGVVRSVLGINEDNRSLIFVGDVPEGSYARLMRAN